MHFTASFVVAATIIVHGVFANVHSTCWCETGGSETVDVALTETACNGVCSIALQSQIAPGHVQAPIPV